MEESWWRLFRAHGPLGWWWKALARLVHEPHVNEWHARDLPSWLAGHGFKLVEDRVGMPFRTVVAEACA